MNDLILVLCAFLLLISAGIIGFAVIKGDDENGDKRN